MKAIGAHFGVHYMTGLAVPCDGSKSAAQTPGCWNVRPDPK